MEDKLSIRVNVADRYYPLKIDRKDEEKIRKAAKMINEKVLQYKQRYTDKDIQDFLAMAALQYVIKVIEFDSNLEISPALEELKDLDNELNEFLKREY
ncbi:MAG TPA: cell division protein ZapA [Bacteroidales bacterium]|jgi:cell division protein ZapA|nr:cell division protein ZapA [Bacteroidales bacterium]